MKYKSDQIIWILLRLSMAWIFLWPFFDKLFGLGFSTKPNQAWILGVSPTTGFLKFGTHGPFASYFQNLAGSAIVDWIFMIGLLLIGLSLLSGIGIKIAGYAGTLMLLLMWLVLIPPEHNPFLDEHLIYAFIMIGLTFMKCGQWFGLGKWWSSTSLVKKYKFLE